MVTLAACLPIAGGIATNGIEAQLVTEKSEWSCRGVAEHADCPRHFYYMTVEEIFLPSADTEQGAGVYRCVDRPSAAPEPIESPQLRFAGSAPPRRTPSCCTRFAWVAGA